MVKYTDKTLMPFGEFKGISLANVPAKSLIWYYDNLSGLSPPLKAYIEDNLAGLRTEAKKAGQRNAG